MKFVGCIFAGIGLFLITLAHYYFIQNIKEENYDVMGASISFDQPFAIGNLLTSIALGILGLLPWYWCICVFIGIEIISLPYKWKLLEPLTIKGLTRRNRQPE